MSKVLQLKIELDEIKPKIWRRSLIGDDVSFFDLYDAIQIVMGRDDYHLYEFSVGGKIISCDEEGYNPAEGALDKLSKSPEFIKMIKEQDMSKVHVSLDILKMNKLLKKMREEESKNFFDVNTLLSKFIKSKKQKFAYCYDFGDTWVHTITVEKIIDSAESCPVCLEGEMACPPEDCGSVPGYYELLELKNNKRHPEYEERIVEWLGEDHDFEYFNIKEVNEELKNGFR